MAQLAPTRFNGDESAARWIASLSMTLVENANTKDWIKFVNALLIEEPAKWADNQPEMVAILQKMDPTEEDKERYASLLREGFPGEVKTELTQEEHENLVSSLRQSNGETLKEYYDRAKRLLVELSVKDNNGANASPSFSTERMVLSQVIKQFVQGLWDEKLSRKVVLKYSSVTDPATRSLKGTYDAAERLANNMVAKELQLQRDIEKAKQEKDAAVAGAVYEIMAGGPNRNKGLRSLQAATNMTAENLTAAFASYVRPPRQQLNRVPSSERIQDVTNEAQPPPATNIQHHSGYAPQDARAQQQAMNTLATHGAPSAPQQRTNNYWQRKGNEDREFDAHSHPNPIINGSLVYNQLAHGVCCYRCGELGHTQFYCDAPREKQLTPPAKKYIMALTGYNPRPRYDPPPEAAAVTVAVAAAPLPNQVTQQQSSNAPNTSFQPTVAAANYYNGKPEDPPKAPPASTSQPCSYMYNPNKPTSDSYEPRAYSVQVGDVIDDGNMENEKSRLLDCNSVTLSSGAHEENTNPKVLAAKRRRTTDKEGSEDEIARLEDAPKVTDRPKKDGVKRKGKKKILKPIAGMINKPEVSVEELLEKSVISLSALHLYQISPFFRDETRRLTQAPRKRGKKKETVAEETAEVSKVDYAAVTPGEEGDGDPPAWALRDYRESADVDKTAFGVPAILSKDGNEPNIGLSYNICKADQGSDLVLIDDELARELKLRYRSTKDFSPRGVTMTVADGNHTRLNHWVIFQINVEGIKRMAWAFVNPRSTSTKLLLGMPWLKSVDAVVMAKQKTIRIGDKDQMETPVDINSYRMASEESTASNKKEVLSQKQLTRLGKTFKHVAAKNQQHAKVETESEYSESEESSEGSSLASSESEDEDFQ